MKKLFLLSIFTLITWAENPHDHMHHSHEGHLHEQLVDGKKLEVDPIRFDNFVMGLEDSQIAVVNVKGMVCDFCARGIEKTFKKDIKFDEIKEKILINGQNAIDMAILNL